MVQSWVLKVTIHCEGCKKKVKKVLQKVQGVYTIDIDSNQSRVTVTGDVDGESLVRKLLKYGKHSELLTEESQTAANSSSSATAAAADSEKPAEITAPLSGGEVEPSKLERSNSEKPAAAVVESEKGEKEVQREESREDDEGGAVYDSDRVLPANPFIVENQPVYTMSYSAVHPSTSYAYYQAPPAEMASSYGYTAYPPTTTTYTPEYYSPDYYSSESYYGSMEPQAPPEGSYDMFSEENPNACNLM